MNDKVAEAQRQRQLALEADWNRDAEQREREMEIEGEKKKLLNDFETWRSHLMLPEETAPSPCPNRTGHAQHIKDTHRTAWITVSPIFDWLADTRLI